MDDIEEIHLEKPQEPEHERFNYRGTHRYLVHLPAYGERAAFAEREVVMAVLGALRDAALSHGFEVYAYCFLPDRLGMIVRGKAEESDFRVFLQAFRTASGRDYEQSREHTLWSKKFQERVLRKEEGTKDSARALFMSVVKAGLVRQPQDYAMLGSFVEEVRDILPRPEPAVAPGGERGEGWKPGSRPDRFPDRRPGREPGFRPGPHQDAGRGKPAGFRPGPRQSGGRDQTPGYRPGPRQGEGRNQAPGYRQGPRRDAGYHQGPGERPGGDRDRRPGTFRPGGTRPPGKRPFGQRPGTGGPGGYRGPGGFRPGGRKPVGRRPGGHKPGGQSHGGFRSGGKRPGGRKPGGHRGGGPVS